MRSMFSILAVLFFSLPILSLANSDNGSPFAVMVEKDKKATPLYAIYKGEAYRVYQTVTAEHDNADKRQVPYIMISKDEFVAVSADSGSLPVGTFKKNDPSKKENFEVYYVNPDDDKSVATLAKYIGNKPQFQDVWLRRWGGCGGGCWWRPRCYYSYYPRYYYGGGCGYGPCGGYGYGYGYGYAAYPAPVYYNQYSQFSQVTSYGGYGYGGGYSSYGAYSAGGGYGGYGGGYGAGVVYTPWWG